jgi:hypothetical protein
MPAPMRLRDAFKLALPWWLSDRLEQGKTAGYRYIWSVVSTLDILAEGLLQGIQAGWPGAGTPDALPYIGRTRGVIRGQSDTNDEYAAKLRAWLERAELWGSQQGIAGELRDYLGNHPRVRVVNRAGHWLTLAQDGNITETDAAFDWDSHSNPERNDPDAPFWSDQWVIIYPTQWAVAAKWGAGEKWGATTKGFGHDVTREEADAVVGLLEEVKSAGSRVRAVIWTSDTALFDPANPASLPDVWWGKWGKDNGSGVRVPSRNTTTCRYWEPR